MILANHRHHPIFPCVDSSPLVKNGVVALVDVVDDVVRVLVVVGGGVM